MNKIIVAIAEEFAAAGDRVDRVNMIPAVDQHVFHEEPHVAIIFISGSCTGAPSRGSGGRPSPMRRTEASTRRPIIKMHANRFLTCIEIHNSRGEKRACLARSALM